VTVTIEPLRRTLLDDARAGAERLLADADERAALKLAEANERGAALIERARKEGDAIGSLAGAGHQAASRRRARALVLAVRRELYEDFCRQAREAVHALRADPRYAALLERLGTAARSQLGEDCLLEIDPIDAGGIRASKGARRVDYTIDALVHRGIEDLGSEVERLWE
jgi:vacuolar-type H+-ATPase subunit E/Vma4